jgi:hypothetical protein
MMETVVKVMFPQKKEIFKPVLHPQKNQLSKVTRENMDGERVAGLILGILSLSMAIAGALMIIGMATGNIWVYFVIGMLLAVFAIILGAVGKRLPFRGLSIAGLAIGIVVVVALLAMLIVFTVLGIL